MNTKGGNNLEVEIIKANNPFDGSSNGKKLERMRVAAYCRVSTKYESQRSSIELQKSYYEEYIKKYNIKYVIELGNKWSNSLSVKATAPNFSNFS